MYMFLFKIFICCFAIVGSVKSQTVELLNGFYQNSSKNDSIEVIKSDKEVIEIKFSDGSKINFGFNENIYKKDNLSKDGYTGVKIINEGKFELFYDHNKKTFETYELYKKPGVLNKIIAFLVTSALFISIFQFYLKLNKVWKRRGIAEVANSISIVAALLGFGVGFPFLLNSLFISGDYPAAGKSVLGLGMAVMMTLISMGYFVEENRGKGFLDYYLML